MRFHLVTAALLVSSTLAHGAILIDNFSNLINDRFANDAQFIADNYNLSGVAIANDGRWATMVSENVFLSSNHYFPANGTNVTFYSSNDPNGSSLTRSIQKSEQVGASDIRIGTLDGGLGSSFSFYDFATDDTTNDNTGGGPFGANSESFVNSPYYQADAYMFGRSPTSFPISQDMAVGRNRLDTWFDDATAAGTTDDAMGAAYNAPGDANYLQYEALLKSGDSGGPMMVDTGNGQMTIVGMNWFTTTADVNGFSYVGNYDAEIQSYIDANPIPEPQTYSLLVGLMILSLTSSRRSARV